MQFERRRRYRHLEPGLQQDARALFRDCGMAQRMGLALLFQIADIQAIADACRQAAEMGLGWLESEEVEDGGATGISRGNQRAGMPCSTWRPRCWTR
jgi:hypothetical protein